MTYPSAPLWSPTGRFRLEARTRLGALVGYVPYNNIQANYVFNGAPTLDCNVPMDQLTMTLAQFYVAKVELWLYRDEVLVYAGPLWNATVSSGDRNLNLHSEGLLSYFDKREIKNDLTFTNMYADDIAWALIAYTQGKANGNLNIAQGNRSAAALGFLSHRRRGFYSVSGYKFSQAILDIPRFNRNWAGNERKKIGAAIADLQQGLWDYDITPDRKFNVYAPNRGSTQTEVLEYGSSISSYSIQFMGKSAVNSMTIQGSGDGPSMLISVADNVNSQETYGLLDGTQAFKDSVDQADIDNKAVQQLALYSTPLVIPQVTLRGGSLDPFGSDFGMGDTLRLRIDDGYVQYDQNVRIAGFQQTIGSEDNETFNLYINDTREVDASA